MGVILGLVACLIMVLVFIIKRMGIGHFKRRLEDHEYKNVGFFPNEQIVIGDEKLQPGKYVVHVCEQQYVLKNKKRYTEIKKFLR